MGAALCPSKATAKRRRLACRGSPAPRPDVSISPGARHTGVPSVRHATSIAAIADAYRAGNRVRIGPEAGVGADQDFNYSPPLLVGLHAMPGLNPNKVRLSLVKKPSPDLGICPHDCA